MDSITEQWLNIVSRVICQKLTSFQNSIGAQYIQFHIEYKKHADIHGSSPFDFSSNNHDDLKLFSNIISTEVSVCKNKKENRKKTLVNLSLKLPLCCN